ncbi:diaminopimelate decarboxylase [[Clostridium] colinum]|uniref:diaminopimelate decarboxylase n=1 Tax=[Clostridium] colinum TaxID=36835 RepID=UPI002025B248|nr:diaminopimelate decarboxylase [[Clostridium] colinum]
MQKLISKVTDNTNFYMGHSPIDLIEKYGSPLYVYNEKILREKIKEMKNLVSYKNFIVNYSAKANSNLAILEIVNQEGLNVDAMSIGEMYIEFKAGFSPEKIFFISNNVSKEEMQYAINNNVLISVDSICQLEQFGQINPGGKVAVRFNGGIGAGHHEKVITAGKNTKFGVNSNEIKLLKDTLKKYNLTLVGINQHIGSLFMDANKYIEGVYAILSIAKQFETLEFIDLGGGFGIPYNKLDENYNTLDIKYLGEKLNEIFEDFSKEYGKKINFKIEPGRYIVAECGVLLGTVHAIKNNENNKYAGTDIGFNVLARPVMYDSHHDIEVYRKSDEKSDKIEPITVVGNICETGDIIAKNRLLPNLKKGDILGILDAGAYGHVMSSNYNNRLRPAEILIRENGEIVVIRKRDTLEDIVKNFISLN